MSRRSLLIALFGLALLQGCSMFGSSKGKDGPQPAELPEISDTLPVATLWSKDVGGGTDGYELVPAVLRDTVYVAAHGGAVTALDAASGQQRWQTNLDIDIAAGPGVGDGIVVVVSKEAEVFALDAETGKQRWQQRVSSIALAAPVVQDGLVVVRTVDGKINTLDASSGTSTWTHSQGVPVLSLHGTSRPVIASDAVIAGFDGGRLVALALSDGKPLWNKRISEPHGRSDLERMVDIDATPAVKEDVLYTVTFQGNVAALDLFSGRILWKRDMSSYAGLSVDAKHVYITDHESYVWALDRFTSASVWRQKNLHNRKLTAPAVAGAYVVAGDYEGYVHWFRSDDGKLVHRLKVDGSGISVAPVVRDGVIYVYGNGGTLAALKVDR